MAVPGSNQGSLAEASGWPKPRPKKVVLKKKQATNARRNKAFLMKDKFTSWG